MAFNIEIHRPVPPNPVQTLLTGALECSGVLLARMALVPLDSQELPRRIAFMVEDCKPSLVFAKDPDLAKDLLGTGSVDFVVGLDELEEACHSAVSKISVRQKRQGSCEDHKHSCSQEKCPDADSYVSHVYFTSGSTGRPKGCIVTRGSLAAYCHGKNLAHGIAEDSVCFVPSAHTFDPCLGDFVATLLAGGTIALAPRKVILSRLPPCICVFSRGSLYA